MLTLPENLEKGIDNILKDIPSKKWLKNAQIISEHYRNEDYENINYNLEQVIGYIAQILPSTYAQIFKAINFVKDRISDNWQPKSVLDIGSGPATSLWACFEFWPSLESFTALEKEENFIKIAKELNPPLKEIKWIKVDLEKKLPIIKKNYDLIILGHVLSELSNTSQERLINWAWRHLEGILLIVEPGTSYGFTIIKKTREILLKLGSFIIAPCPHNEICQNNWCHFPQRIKRPFFEKRAKGAISQWEDAKLSFLACSKINFNTSFWGILLRNPKVTKGFVDIDLCAKEGLMKYRVLKRDKENFKKFKKLQWGEILIDKL